MPQCGFSAKAAGLLNDLGVKYTSVNILEDRELREGMKQFGDWPTFPQLYINQELIGGSDIIAQMYDNGSLRALLGLSAPDRTPPKIHITPAAERIFKDAHKQAPESVFELELDGNQQPQLDLVPKDPQAIFTEVNGITIQVSLATAQRARKGITIDWVTDFRGEGLIVVPTETYTADNANASSQEIREISPQEAKELASAGKCRLIDVRQSTERAQATVNVSFTTLDPSDHADLEQLPKDTPLVFLCHFGRRSLVAAEEFRRKGFHNVASVHGGIDAWAVDVDPTIKRYS